MAKHLVIMAGGIGSRFWPMSTPQKPKQFIDITGCGRTMIQQTFDRFDGIIDIDHVWVVTSASFKELVAEQLTGINPQHILLEPCMRNTAPCVAYVSWKIQKEDPEALIVVAPSDHLVMKTDAFKAAIAKGFEFVAQGDRILTLGMTPTRPETGYGYIEQGTEACPGIFNLAAFREKPDLQTAISYLEKGGYTWNSGMFMWSAATIVEELRKYASQIAGVMDQILPAMFTDREQEVVNELFPTCEKISIDYAVMEKTQVAFVQPAEFGWSDLGTWGSLHTLTAHDDADNAVIGDSVRMIEASGNMVKVPDGKQVVIQGLKNCIVSEHNGVLLICQLSEEQRIKEWHD
ncbi:MAG: mannose-1-phosphate guanylyltransferase [Bacteroidaceae bacterium]|nr:mannose-1-phosphate guanylyltransferase [Bacteroidaceae bacterium]